MLLYRKCRFTGWAACRTLSLTLCLSGMTFISKGPTLGRICPAIVLYQSSVSLTWQRAPKNTSSASSALPYLVLCDGGAAATAWLFFSVSVVSVPRRHWGPFMRPPIQWWPLSPRHGLPSLTHWHTSRSRRVAEAADAQRQKHFLLAFWNHMRCRVARTSRFMRTVLLDPDVHE